MLKTVQDGFLFIFEVIKSAQEMHRDLRVMNIVGGNRSWHGDLSQMVRKPDVCFA
jgi:hypothetical protein